MSTYAEIHAALLEVAFVETPAGDVFASALVSPTGEILRVVDDDGNDLTAWPIETGGCALSYREHRREVGLS